MNSWTKAGTELGVLCSSSAIGVILFANRHCRRQCSTPPAADPHASFASPDTLHTIAAYYSCCFSVCDGVAAQRACDCRAGGYSVSPSFGRRGSGGEGCHAGAVVVPAGACLVASPPA